MKNRGISVANQQTEYPSLLRQLASCYSLDIEQLQPLTDNLEDGVYGFTSQGREYVVKCIPTTDRGLAEVRSQVGWINYLAAHGGSVCKVVLSGRGNLVEEIKANDRDFSAVCYERASGRRPEAGDFTAEHFQKWGQLLGKVHAITVSYSPTQAYQGLPDRQDSLLRKRRQIPADQHLILDKFDALLDQVQRLPKDGNSYGLTHGDFQANNLILDHGTLTLFDFDDCQYCWFISDLAIALYFTLWEPHPGYDNLAFATFVLDNMLAGYRAEKPVAPFWIEQIPLFLKFQEMLVYIELNEYNQMAQGQPLQAIPERHRNLLVRYRHNIEYDIPYLESAYNPWSSN
jgi:Ser/Thr protein kinase RdoA (MazF antagonist)